MANRLTAGLVSVVAVVLVAAGCGGTVGGGRSAGGSFSGGSSTGSGQGYLASDGTTFADFIQWTDNGGTLSGSLQEDTVSGTAPDESVNATTYTLAGSLDGSKLTVTLNGGTPVFGTVSKKTVTLNIPQESGGFRSESLRQDPLSSFNRAIADLRQTASSANSQANNDTKVSDEQSSVTSAAAAVRNNITNLSGEESSLGSDVSGMDNDMNSIKTDLGTTSTDEQKVIAEGPGDDEVCSDAQEVASDAQEVASDVQDLSSSADSLGNDQQTLSQDEGSLTTDFKDLTSAEAAAPRYGTGLPTAADVNAAQQAAMTAAKHDVDEANADLGEGGQEQAAAYADAAKAASAGNCPAANAAPPEPTTLPGG